MKISKVLMAAILLFSSVLYSQIIKRAEPPFWWTEMKNPVVEVMLYGEKIGDCTVSVDYSGVSVLKVERSENPNYLFVDLNISEGTLPGKLQLVLSKDSSKISYPYELKKRNKSSRKSINSADVVYLITPDRFVNGDYSNDNTSEEIEKVDRDNPDARHGGDIAGIRSKLDHLKDMGVTSLWINPVFESNMNIYSYHGYSITDFYRVDPRYGSNSDYAELVSESHSKGLKIIMDMVFNQIGSNHWWMKDLPARDWIHQFDKYTKTNFAGSTIPDPHSAHTERDLMVQGWFDTMMPDMNQRNPHMAKYLIQNTIWWVEFADLDGIRMDTYQYNYKEFMNDWLKALYSEYPGLYVVGEVWLGEPSYLAYWSKNGHSYNGFSSELRSVTDFALFDAFSSARESGALSRNLYRVLTQDFLYQDPNNNLIFADNHDTQRIFSTADGDMNLYKSMLGLLLTIRGIPQIYYGTELLMTGNSHGLLRADYPGGWKEDKADAFRPEGRTKRQNEAFGHMTKLLNWRKAKDVIHTGKMTHYLPWDNVYVYFRHNDEESVMVAFNDNDSKSTVDLSRFSSMLDGYKSGFEVTTGSRIENLDKLTLERNSLMIIELKK